METRKEVDFILKAEYLITMEEETGVLNNASCAVSGNLILDVGPSKEIEKKYFSDHVLGGKRKVLMPGLINTHTHAPMVLMRGIADDLPLREWLEKHIWPLEEKWLGAEFINDATLLACLEMIKAGITTYNDMYFYEKEAAPAIKKTGIRAVLGSGIVDFPTKVAKTTDEYFQRAEENINFFLSDSSGLLVPSIAPHALYTCGPETMKRAVKMADKYGIMVHLHVAETRWETEQILKLHAKTPVRLMEELGVLSERIMAAHCVWVDEEEIVILAKRKVGVAHCVESNLKLASGIAPVAKMLRSGVRVTFGTDGAASNNDLNLLGEISTAAKLHKAVSGDPTVLDAKTALQMATIHAARASGLGEKIGSIKKGKLADLILIDIAKPHLTPVYNIYSQLVYAAGRQDVEAVMVNGKLLLKKRKLLTADEKEILDRAHSWAKKIKSS